MHTQSICTLHSNYPHCFKIQQNGQRTRYGKGSDALNTNLIPNYSQEAENLGIELTTLMRPHKGILVLDILLLLLVLLESRRY